MTTTISHWGNSLGIRIPASIARQAGITAGRDVTFDVQDGNIIVRPMVQQADETVSWSEIQSASCDFWNDPANDAYNALV